MVTGKKRALASLCLLGIIAIHCEWISALAIPEPLLSVPKAEASGTECSDNIDNDGDGKVDALIELDAYNGETRSWTGDTAGIRSFVNGIAAQRGYTQISTDWHGQGMVNNDSTTAAKVCEWAGFSTVELRDCYEFGPGAGGRCNFTSCGDNTMGKWNSSMNNIQITCACGTTWLASLTCRHRLPACSDGVDNDGDGSIDSNDSGCATSRDDNERAHDPDCTDPNDNTERVAQCNDGLDNDGDGATDLNDYSCSSGTDDDETNPKSECQDGLDNDSNGLTDYPNDPGCSSKQDNDEDGFDQQCGDGVDNDGDGATDYPNDFSCSSSTDNDETNPKAECGDGMDNDGNGLIDFPNDPGCSTKQDNDEDGYDAQCSDGLDNDGDGATDFSGGDFSCSSGSDNDETNPKALCQDGLDNDGDGLTDFPNDPGCSSKQDNDEYNAPVNDADCVGISAPSSVIAGSTFNGTITMRNTGTSTWTSSSLYRIGTQNPQDNTRWGANNRAAISPSTVAPGQSTVSTYPATAPSTPGTYSFDWKMVQDGTEWFGETCTKSIQVTPAPQCSDGLDNDGDGAMDFSGGDFSCSSATDTDETNPKSECQDGLDNDGNGIIDFPNDPGCSSKQDNDEDGFDPQCSDGLDNDGDGATDFSGGDFSCSSSSDNDETNPKAQCQDGLDNDSDGLIDFPNDPGCSSKQDNVESPQNVATLTVSKSGPATAIPGDTLIYSVVVQNTSSIPASQVEVVDPAHGTNGQTVFQPSQSSSQCVGQGGAICYLPSLGPNQTVTLTLAFRTQNINCGEAINNIAIAGAQYVPEVTSNIVTTRMECDQCSDGEDNDGDGATDYPDDFSCSSDTDDDETNPKSECQDGLDNDGNGLIDFPNDPGCSSKQDNDEDGFDPQCNDGLDNDGDGATDFSGGDFSCSSATDNDETNPKAQCQDGLDNDGNGLIDFPNDPGCSSQQDNVEQGGILQADLSITKSGPVSVMRGSTVIYTITATNNGPHTAQNVTIGDNVPSGLQFNAAQSDSNCALVANTVRCNNITLSSGQSETVNIAFTVPTTVACNSTIQNVASVSASTTDTNPANNQSQTVSTTVNCPPPQADLRIAKTGPSTVVRGNTVSYTLTATNDGPDTATNVAVQDPIPSSLTFNQSASSSSCVQNGTNIICNNFSLTSSQSRTFTVVFNVPSTYTCNGTIQNSASVASSTTDPNSGNNQSQTVSTSVTCPPPQADLRIAKTGPSTVVRGNTVSYTLTATNGGPDTATNVTVQDPIPSGLTFNPSASSTSCVQNGSNVLCNNLTLVNGQSQNFTVAFSVPSTYTCNGTIQNSASVASSTTDPNSGNNQSQTVSTSVTCPPPQADLRVAKTGPSTVVRGGTVSYTLTATNDGPDTATNVAVQDPIPSGLVFNQGASSSSCVQNGGNILCNNLTLVNGQSQNFTVAFDVPATYTCNGTIQNSASVSASATDPNPANNQSQTVSTTVQCPVYNADLTIIKDGPLTVGRNQTVSYTIIAVNNGPQTAQSVVVTDPIPTGLTFNASASSPECAQVGASIRCSGFNLTSGQSKNLTVAFIVPVTAACDSMILNTASITSSTTDPNTGNNQSANINTRVDCTLGEWITLDSVHIDGCNVTIDYEKNFTTCAHMRMADPPGSMLNTTNSLCANQGPVTVSINQFTQDLVPGLDVYLCHGNNCSNVQSNVVTVTGGGTCQTGADVSVSKTGPSTVARGNTVSYTLTALNSGPDTATNVIVQDPIPAGLTFNQGASSSSCVQNGTNILCNNFTLVSGQSQNFTVAFNVPSTAVCNSVIQNTSSVSAATTDPNPANNQSQTISTTVQCPAAQADVTVSKTGPSTVTRGNTVSYTLTALNNGPDTATNVAVQDPIPAGLTFNQSASSAGCVQNGTNILCNNLTLVNGQSQNFTVAFNVPSTAVCNSVIQNTASVSTSATDPNPANNQSQTVSTTVQCQADQADLQLAKTGPATVNPGQTAVYTLTLTNAGPAAAATVSVTDALPSYMSFNAAQSDSRCTVPNPLTPNIVACTLASLPAGSTESFSITVDIAQAATCNMPLVNSASATSATQDPNSSNNTNRSVSSTVQCPVAQADVTVSKTGPSTVTRGNAVSYTLTALNNGPDTATNVVVEDPIPSGLTFNQSASSAGCVQNGANILCNNLTLTNGQSQNFTVTFNVPTTYTCNGMIQNTASVSTSATDPNPGNNQSQTVSTTVQCPTSGCIDVTKEAYDENGQLLSPVPQEFTMLLDGGVDGLMTDSGGHGRFTNVPVGSHNVSEIIPAGWLLFSKNPPSGNVSVQAGSTCASVTFKNREQPVLPFLTIEKTDNRTTVSKGETLVYTITVHNSSNVDALDVAVGDLLPYQTTYVSSSNGGVYQDPLIIWNNLTIPAGGQLQLTLTVQVKSTVQPGDNIVNMVQIHHGQTAIDQTTVVDSPVFGCIDIVKEAYDASNQPIPSVPQFTFELDGGVQTTVNNSLGLARFQNVAIGSHTVSEIVPSSWILFSITPANGIVSVGSGPTCSTVLFKDKQRIQGADVSVTKSGPLTVTRGTTVSYTLRATNDGPDSAMNVLVEDPIPAGLTFNAGASSADCLQSGNSVLCDNLTLSNGQSHNFTVAFNVPATYTCNGTIQNAASVSSSTTDPYLVNNQSQTISTTVLCPVEEADLSLTKTGPSTVVRGNTVSYTLTALNNGPDTATSVVVEDPVPAGLTFDPNSSTAGCVLSSNIVRCDNLTLTDSQSRSFVLVFNVPATYTCNGVVQNDASISSSVTDPNLSNNQSQTISTTVQCPVEEADLSVTKTGPSTVARGNIISYTLTALNNGPDTATNVVVTDSVPAGLTFNSNASSTSCILNGGNVLCNNFTLTDGQSRNFTVAFNVPTTYTCNGVVQNIASVSAATTDPNPGNNQSQTVSTTVQCPVAQADVTVSKNGPGTVVRGNTVSYTLTALNNGPDTATNVVVEDPIPSGLTFNQSASSAGCVQNGANILCNNLTLTSGQSQNFTVAFNVPATYTCNGMIQNAASISTSATDPNPANNQSQTISTTVQCTLPQADLQLEKTGPSTANPGGTDVYTLTLTNAGPDAAANIEVTDVLPAFMSFNAAQSDNRCAAVPATPSIVECTLSSLAAGDTESFSITVNISQTATCNMPLVNSASAVSSTEDPNDANNTHQSVSTTVQCQVAQADVSVTKSGASTTPRGASISYTLRATNNGPDTATNVVVEDPVPAGLTFNPGASSAGCVLNGNNVLCNNLTLTSGQSQNFTVTFDIPSSFTCGGVIENEATVSTSATDPNPANNISQTVSTTVDCSHEYTDVGIEKIGPSTVLQGGTISYSVTVTNNGPATAQGVTINDPVPAGLTFNPTASDPSCVQNGVNILCNNIALSNGQQRTVTVAFNVPQGAQCGTVFTNRATVSTSTTDPNSANNTSAQVQTAVDCPVLEADLDIVKTGRTQIPRDETLIYMVQVLNRGPDTAQDVIVTDAIPAGLTFNAGQSDSTCAQVGTDIVCTGPALPASLQWSVNIAFDINQSVQCAAIIENQATVASTTQDPVSSNNTSAVVGTVVECPGGEMSISKTGPSTVLRGEKVTYNITVTNNSATTQILNSLVFDQTPAHSTFVPADSTPGCYVPQNFPDVFCPAENIPVGDTRDIVLTFEVGDTAPCDSFISNIADAWADNASTTWSNEVLTQVICSATDTDIGISKTGPATVTRGNLLTYVLTVTNSGPGDATGVEIADPIPAGLTFNAGGSSAGCQVNGAEVVCSGINLVSGDSVDLTLAFSTSSAISCGSSVHNQARVQSTPQGDPNPQNNLSQIVSTTVNCPAQTADLSITKTGPQTAMRGSTVTYTVTATNAGPDTATNVVIADTIPSIPHETLAVMVPLVFNPAQSDPACVVNGPNVLCDNFTLDAGDDRTVLISFTIPDTGECSSIINNQATVSASSTDPNPLDNASQQVQTTVECPVTDADLTISKTGQPIVEPGHRVSFDLTATNLGPSTATNVTMADPIPTVLNSLGQPVPLTFDPAASDPGCVVNGGNILCNNFSLTSGQSKTMTVSFTVPAEARCDASISNQATVSGSSTDPNPANNTSNTVTARVYCPVLEADLGIVKMGRDRIPRGETLLYTLQVFNYGPESAADVTYTDPIPTGLTFNAGQSDSSCQQVGNNIVCTKLALSDGMQQSVTIAFDIGSSVACGSFITNTATVSSTTQDPNAANNASLSVQTFVECPADQVLIEKTGSSSVVRGEKITYDITVTNSGSFTVLNASIFDTVPPNLTYIPAESSQDCSYVGTANPPVVFCSPANLTQGQQRQVTLVFQVEQTASCGGVISNIADVWSDNADPNWSNEVLTHIQCPAVTFTIEKTDNLTTVAPGETITYQVSVTNTSAVDATNVEVIDTLPSNVTYVAASDSGTFDGTRVTWDNLSIGAGDTKVLSLTVSVNSGAQEGTLITNTASVVNGPTALDQTTVVGELTFAISKSDGRTGANAGETLIYTITVENTSSTDANSVTVRDTLPANVTYVSSDNGGTHSSGVAQWTGLSIPAGQTLTLHLTVTINAAAPGGTTLTNTVQIVGGPSATDTTIVNGGSQYGCIDVVKEVFNVDGSPMTPVPQEFTFLLDGGVDSFMTDGSGHGRFTNVPVASHNVAEIIPFGWLLFEKSPANGYVQVQPGPNCSTITFKNRKQPDPPFLTIEKTDNRTTVSPGETLVYTVTVRNSSNVDAIDVSVGDLLPMQTTYISSSDGGVYQDPLIIWYGLTVPAGGEKELTLTVQVKPNAQNGEQIVNMAQIHHGLTAIDYTTVTIIEHIGCIDIVKETFDTNSQPITPVAQFTFKLDGGTQTTANNSLGRAQFLNVPTGTHTVSEIVPPSWQLLSVTPPNGLITVSESTTCSTVLFKNKQQLNGIDFVMSKTDNRTTVTTGETLTYTITVENTSAKNATGVTVLDTLPANTTFVSASNGGTHSSGTVTWNNLTVNANSTITLTITATVNTGTAEGTVLTNNASIPNKTSAVDTTTVSSQQPTFTISKTDNLTTATPGQTLTYTITINNTSAFAASNVTVTDTLPSQVTYVSSSDSGTVNGQVVTWTGVSIAAGGQKQLTIQGTVNSGTANGTVLTNTAQIQNGPSAVDTTTVSSTQPTLTISKTDNRTTVTPGESLTYIITVQNTSTTTATNVSVGDQLPGNTTFVSASNGGTLNGQVVTWNNLTVNASSSLTLTLQATVNSSTPNGTVLTNVTQIAGGMSATDTTTVQGGTPDPNNVTIDLTDDRDPVDAGESFCYTVRVTNLNSSQLTNQTVTQTLDGDTEYQSSSQGGSHSSNIITWNSITLPANGTVTMNSCVSVDDDTDKDILSSQAFISSKSDTETTRVGDFVDGDTDCEVQSISDSPDPVAPGEEISYSIRVRNGRSGSTSTNGTSTLFDIVAFLDNDVEFLSASDGGDDDNGREVEWQDIRLRRGESDSVSLTVRVKDTARDERVRIRVQCEDDEEYENTRLEGEGEPSDGKIQASIDKRASRQEAKPGDTVTYTVTLRNLTNREAKNVTIEDRFNAGSISIQDAGGGKVVGNGIDWTLPTLGANDTRIFTYHVRIGPDMRHGQIISNSVIAKSSDFDRSPTDMEEVRILTELPQTGMSGFGDSFESTTQNLRPTKVILNTTDTSAAMQFILWTSIISIGILGGSFAGRRMFF
ncbi:hypothetical protein A2217_00110 [Candidatus Peribacteria bacterium RIFOXYA2_FULL_55_28]|nr:MAG: hypothetical protein A2217_00110 [Candidatus Peribacteria bacterium RIFOXYA2_FULL_55_28]OGJ75470.1 MAG: hypothetical protein A2384_01070 [Candidatus Peribacteria bacterium RIFOXYB1_FULL_54_35]